jgi:hypothetical protein
MRAFHGAKQDTASAQANRAPGFDNPHDPARIAKSPANTVTPVVAAATMHDSLAEDAKKLANGNENVPIHPAQVPSEGSDTQETEGDGSVRDPTGIGRGT